MKDNITYTDQDIAEAERLRQLFMQSVFLNDEIVVIDCNGDASIDEIKGSAQCAIKCLEEKIASVKYFQEVEIKEWQSQIAYLTEKYLKG